jgi:hypothetical protein
MEPWWAVDTRSGNVEGQNGAMDGSWTLAVETWRVKMKPWRVVDTRSGDVDGQNGAMAGCGHSQW